MWGFWATPQDPTTTNNNLANKPYFCLFLLSNRIDDLIPFLAKLFTLCIFDPFSSFYTSWYCIPLVALDNCWARPTFSNFDLWENTLENGYFCYSEADAPSMDGPSCTGGSDCNNASVLLLFSGATLRSWLRISLEYSSRYGVNQVLLISLFSRALLCELWCTRSVQFGVIGPSLINGTVENLSSNTTCNWGETWPVYGFINRATDPAWHSEWPRYIHAREWSSHLDIPAMLPCIIASNP